MILRLACVVGFAGSYGVAGEPDPPAVSPSGTDSAADSAKVHGTITVDFEKVTIAELLKLVSVVEKVDGVIHIVSSKSGDDAIVVSGSQGTVALARPSSPDVPNMILGPRHASTPPAPTPRSPVASRRHVLTPQHAAPEFPRLAALGRLLGFGGRSEVPSAAASPARDSVAVEPASPRRDPEVATASAVAEVGAPSIVLDAGSRLGSLAAGETKHVGPFHSPWPKAEQASKRPAPTRDAEVTRTEYATQVPTAANAPKRVSSNGESFAQLARRFYGDSRYAWALWWANRDRVAWPDALAVGKSIRVPALGELEPKMIMAEAAREATSPRSKAPGAPRDPEVVRASLTPEVAGPETARVQSEPGGFAVHVVRPDDTLRIIAREKCGDERKALEIIALNRDVLTPEGRPRVGQRLVLPAPDELAASNP